MLTDFANQAAIAIQNAQSYAALWEARDYQEQLIGTSLDGIIAIDEEGWVTVFNDGAEQILGYKRDEVLDRKKRVDQLYWNLEGSRGIDSLLREHERLKNYETAVRSKDGEIIPIMLSAILLRDSQGHPMGSVGFFKDLRPIKKAEGELELLLDTMNTVAGAPSLEEGLSVLAKKMVMGLSVTFCHIMLLDDSGQELLVKAAYPTPRPQSGDPLVWEPGVGKLINLSEVTPMQHLLHLPEPRVFRRGEVVEDLDVVQHIRKVVNLKGILQSVLVIPLKVGDTRVFGVYTLGEMRNWERSPFTKDRIELASSMAAQAAVLIDRMRAHEATERRLAEVKRLREIGEDLVRAVADSPKEILDRVAQAACEVVGAGCAIIYPWHKEEKSYDVSNIAHFGLRQKKSFSDKTRDEERSMTSIVLNKGIAIVDDISKCQDRTGEIDIWRKSGGLIELERIEALVGIALRVGEEPLGALFVNFREPHYFTNDELETITLFANQAAVAIQQSRLFQQVSEEATQLRLGLLEVGSSISELRSLEDTLYAVARGIQQVLGCDVATVYSYDDESGVFPHPAVVAGELRVPQKMRGHGPLSRNKVFRLLLERPDPHLADNAPKDEIMSAGGFVKREKIRSSAGIRLSVGGRPVGLLFVNFRKRHQFSESEKNAIRIFANQAAIAIENARLYEETRRRALEQEMVSRIAYALNTPDVRDAFPVLVEGLQDLTGCDLVNLIAMDEAGEQFIMTVLESPFPIPGEGDVMPLSATAALESLQAGRPHLTADLSTETRFPFEQALYQAGLRSQVTLPLLVRGEVFGALNLGWSDTGLFQEGQLAVLQQIADAVALALENSLLFQREREQRELAEALEEAAAVVSSTLELDQVLDRILEQVSRVVSNDATNIMLIEGGQARIVRWRGYERFGAEELVSTVVFRIPEVPNLQQMLDSKEPIVIPDTATYPGWVYVPVQEWLCSYAAAPIIVRGKVIGFLNVDSATPGFFTQSHVEALRVFADHAAAAIENARLYSELKEAYGELKEFDKRKSEFLSTVSHELRTPLTPIKSCLENMLGEMYGSISEKQQARLEMALASANDEARLVENLLDLVRIQEGRVSLDLEFESVTDIVQSIIQVFEYDAEEKQIGLRAELPTEDDLVTQLDRGKIKQVLSNLVHNAIKFTPTKGGSVTVSALSEGEWIKVRVADTGIGIPENELERIFDRFYQVDSSLTRKVGGTGIGLNIAKEYVEMHGGKIWVESKLREGSTFTFTLPKGRGSKDND